MTYYFSLSSIPSRFEKLPLVIDSLVNQTVKPQKIFINIPVFYSRLIQYVDFSKIPDFSHYKDIVVVNIVKYDWGPATKLLPLLRNDSGNSVISEITDDTPIIIVDDDIVYNPDLSETLLKSSSKYRDSCITVSATVNATYLFDIRVWISNENTQKRSPCGFPYKIEGYVDAFEAFRGTLLKKRFFKSDVFDFPHQEFYYADDIWFSGHIIKNGFTIVTPVYNSYSDYLQVDVDALSADGFVRAGRTKLVATYFKEKYGIW